jgi:hypothetical protein
MARLLPGVSDHCLGIAIAQVHDRSITTKLSLVRWCLLLQSNHCYTVHIDGYPSIVLLMKLVRVPSRVKLFFNFSVSFG